MKIHSSVTAEVVEEAVRDSMESLSNPGFCLACGDYVEGVEPDARKYKCEACEENAVYGAEEVLFLL